MAKLPKVVVSERFELIAKDIKPILMGALMAGIGAFVAFLAENVAKIDFKEFTPFVVMGVSVLANAVRKWISETQYK